MDSFKTSSIKFKYKYLNDSVIYNRFLYYLDYDTLSYEISYYYSIGLADTNLLAVDKIAKSFEFINKSTSAQKSHLLSSNFIMNSSPNPFNGNLNILIEPTNSGIFSVGIYDVNGKLVNALFGGSMLSGTKYYFFWNGKNYRGERVPSNNYFILFKDINKQEAGFKAIQLLK